MCNFSFVFYFIPFGILWSLPFCKGATHWIVTEDGRIQQQVDSVFNLKRPYDLVTFIQQQTAFDRLKILREEYLEEKRKVIKAREKERAETQKSFYKEEPDCVDVGGHISEFELHLDMTLPFTKKGINVPDHLSLCQSLPSHVDPPVCQAQLPTVVYSYDHLEGVNHRHQLNATAEPGLLTALSYFKTAEELGGQVSLALQKNSSCWILLNLAAYYWRIKGNAPQAVECLRQALYFSPKEHKDRALMSLAAVLYHANHPSDSLVLLHTALDTCQEYSVYHFLLGNIYASLKMYEMAELCYRFTVVVSPDTKSLCERIRAVRCELKLEQLLKERQLAFNERLDSLETPELDEDEKSNNDEADKKHFLPLETYKKQLNWLYLMTETLPRNPDTCKSRSVPLKQEVYLPPDDTGTAEIQESQLRNTDLEKSADNQQHSKGRKENVSSGSQTQPQVEESMHKSMALQSDSKLKSSKRKDDDKERTVWKEKGKTTESLKATNFQLNNSKNFTEVKTVHDLEEARLALTRLKNVMKTATHANSASQTVDMTEADKVLQTEKAAKTIAGKPSLADSTSTIQEKESKIRKGNAGRRGESGFKMLKRDPGSSTQSKEDSTRTVITGDPKLAKQKGESISISKDDPGSKFESLPSKNARESPLAELQYKQPKGSLPVGPKHTPPLRDKEPLANFRKCENLGTKKRKGEAFTAECFTQDHNKQTQGSSAEKDTGVKQTLSTTEFTEGEINEQSTTRSDIPSDSDGEAVLMKQTSADRIYAAASTDSPVSERTAEASIVEIENTKQNDQVTTSANDKRDLKVSENNERKTTPTEEVMKSKTSGKEVDNAKDTGRTATGDTGKNPENSNEEYYKSKTGSSSSVKEEQLTVGDKSNKVHDATKASLNIKEQVKNAQNLHSVGAGSSVFETSFMNVRTDGSLQDLSEEECRHIEGVHALIVRNKQFSAWLSLDTKNVDVRAHIDFVSDVGDFPRRPRCTAKIKNNLHTFHNLQGVVNAASLDQVAEVGLTQTLLTIGRTMQGSVDEMGTRIYIALKKNSSSWVLLNVASLYWRVQGDTVEAIKCLRQALYFSPSHARDVAHVGLASILLREGQLDDTAVVIKKALEITPGLALGHFILGNVFGAQGEIPEAIQHYLLALQLEPGFTPAVERLKIIQCVLWKQQKALEKEAADLKKLLTPN